MARSGGRRPSNASRNGGLVAFNARFWSKVFPGMAVRRAEARDRAAVSPGEGAEPHPAGPPTEGAPGRPGRRNAAHRFQPTYATKIKSAKI